MLGGDGVEERGEALFHAQCGLPVFLRAAAGKVAVADGGGGREQHLDLRAQLRAAAGEGVVCLRAPQHGEDHVAVAAVRHGARAVAGDVLREDRDESLRRTLVVVRGFPWLVRGSRSVEVPTGVRSGGVAGGHAGGNGYGQGGD
ncbi:hypothetical protein GCM10020000_78130 [Streptomyces olivoverticillatus]